MRLRAGIPAAAAFLLLLGAAGAEAKRPAVLGVSWEGVGKLSWLDARTLAPSGRRVAIGPPPTGLAAKSPDGRTIALSSGRKAELRFVDIRALRARGRLVVGGTGSLRESIWPRADRLVAVRSGLDAEILVIDPRARRVLERRPLEGQPMYVIPAGKRLVALFAPKGAIGQTWLAVIEQDASVRTLVLPRVEAGFTVPRSERDVGRDASPGLAVDPRGTRAVVATPDAVLEVDLDQLAVVRRHGTVTRTPAAAAKLIEGWSRGVLWLGDDAVAVFGSTSVVEGDRVKNVPTGVDLVDLATGARTSLDPEGRATRVGNVLVTFGGSALRGYDFAGNRRFELLRGRDTAYVQSAGHWIYVGRDNSTAFTVVDARVGKVVGTARTPHPTIVLGR